MDRGWYFRLAIVVGSSVLGFLALWPSVDRWLPCPDIVKETFENQINPGLDIKGGLRLMYEVEVDEYIRDRRDRVAEQVQRQCGVLIGVVPEEELDDIDRPKLEEIRRRCKVERIDKDGGAVRAIRITFSNQEDAQKLSKTWVKDYFRDLRVASGVGDLVVDLHMREEQLANMRETAVRQSERTITNRIDSMGVLEPTVIARPNDGDIIIEIPGAQESSFERIKSIISRTAQLQFKIVDDESDARAVFTAPPEGILPQPGLAGLCRGLRRGRAGSPSRIHSRLSRCRTITRSSIGRQASGPRAGRRGLAHLLHVPRRRRDRRGSR